ncbi:hypothetical protein BU24DRAFT_419648 [Aaosphaeria arxii CBS 175.79]|uniref:Uncharacterized protein n=1 Tax=Aaosphaeria arxii CBS 175.79 TaxID=1450172 RepID=A0A6A5Y459_9PLEO|nr:uncharacterized protein BU24DRAFT_419648 [Aaosphaeria arxii CBS 175.79]KAF2020059.1 hypothetical protein BU24DRAFT_419648 [Aaosphaeria arxii CBS 175.79]
MGGRLVDWLVLSTFAVLVVMIQTGRDYPGWDPHFLSPFMVVSRIAYGSMQDVVVYSSLHNRTVQCCNNNNGGGRKDGDDGM